MENFEKQPLVTPEEKDARTGVYRKVELNKESVEAAFSKRWLNPEDIPEILNLGVEEIYAFENRVGNYKTVPLLIIGGKKYILKKATPAYFSRYAEIQAAEHRPLVQEVTIGEHQYGLFDFKGETVMDFTNKEHLLQLCDLGIASARRLTTFDPNEGNLLIDENRLYYIDEGLEYTKSVSTADAILANFQHVIQHVPVGANEGISWILYCAEQFKERVAPINLAENEQVDELINFRMAPLFWDDKKITIEDKEKIRAALRDLFAPNDAS